MTDRAIAGVNAVEGICINLLDLIQIASITIYIRNNVVCYDDSLENSTEGIEGETNPLLAVDRSLYRANFALVS